MHELSILNDIALAIITATVAAHILRIIKQPLILAYVAGGILLGPHIGLSLVHDEISIEIISGMGLVFLLFIIGLEIDLRKIVSLGKKILLLALIQFLAGTAITALIFHFLPMAGVRGKFDLLYTSFALNLSSTLIVVKLLKDKFETETAAGRLTIAILILQDIWAIIFMAFQPNFSNPDLGKLLYSLFSGIVLVSFSFIVSKYLLSSFLRKATGNPELVLLSAISWCFLLSAIAQNLGLSREMGALIAGVSISAFPYGNDVISKISGIRDFFITLFFVSLGLKFPSPTLKILIFSLFAIAIVFLTRFFSVAFPGKFLKLGDRASFLTAINLSQISEFSLVIAALGVSYGHIGQDMQNKILSATLFCSLVSTYTITFNDKIFLFVSKFFKLTGEIETNKSHREERDILILGYFKETKAFLKYCYENDKELCKRMAIVDFNEQNSSEIKKTGAIWIYGDLSAPDSLSHIHQVKPSIVVSSVPDMFLKGSTNLKLLKNIKNIFPSAKTIFTAQDETQEDELLSMGAELAVSPQKLAGQEFYHSIKKLI